MVRPDWVGKLISETHAYCEKVRGSNQHFMKMLIKERSAGFRELSAEELSGIYGGSILTSILESGISRTISLIGLADALYELGKGFVDGAKQNPH